MRQNRAIPFHPVPFAVAPILFVYAHNAAKIRIDPGELLLPVALSLFVTGVLWTTLGLLLHSATRAATVVSLILVTFFSYGHIAEAFGPEGRAWTDLLLLCASFTAAGIWLAVSSRPAVRGSPSGITVLLNSVAAAILLLNAVNGVRAFAYHRPILERERGWATTTTKDYPDIYYIIADSYTRSDVLQSCYHTDNSAFLDDLSSLGFSVADRARSNYVMTYLSLASSLNFTYLDSLTGIPGPESDDYGPMIDMIQHSRLVGFLRRRGYAIASFASDIAGLDLRDADVHFVPKWALSEFHGVLANTTLLRDVFYLLRMSPNDLHRRLVLYTLKRIPDAGHGRHPVFVWAHVLCPHKPFVFDSLGGQPVYSLKVDVHATSRSSSKTQVREWLDTYYGPQVSFLNTLLDDAVRRILAQSARPPIIIIQGDHGPGAKLNWGDPAGDEPSVLRERHAILNAVYLPPSDTDSQPSAELYDSITPVNTFRVILSRYLDTTMALLPDRCYFSTPVNPYQLYDMDRLDSSLVRMDK